MMRHTLQVLKGIEPEVEHSSAQPLLPLLATANDVRGVVQYLRKRPEGVTLSEAIDAIKKQVFEPAKIAAYEALNLIEQEGNLLKLTPLGWDLARSLEPETRAFCAILGRIEPYHSALVWAQRRQLDYLIHPDVAAYWREHHPQVLGINTPKMIEANVGCFFQLCQAAALGTNIIGKKGQPTRLRFDRETLAAYVARAHAHIKIEERQTIGEVAAPDGELLVANAGSRSAAEMMSAHRAPVMQVLIVGNSDESITAPLRALFALADVPYRMAVREQTDVALLPLKFLAAMRECQAAVIVLRGAEQLAATEAAPQLSQQAQAELSVALALYERRIVLLCDEPVAALPALTELLKCQLADEGLSWEIGLGLMQLVKNFRQQVSQ
ncbi:MAG: hypothetical protein DMF64_15355 [Acidobacteria bacterium]|nr:MAG: hypothetical protein DMF64_15355 [Acidobacteriota bacterium]